MTAESLAKRPTTATGSGSKLDWFEPELNTQGVSFGQHYGNGTG